MHCLGLVPLCHLPGSWPQESYLTSLWLSCPICKIGTMCYLPHRVLVMIVRNNMCKELKRAPDEICAPVIIMCEKIVFNSFSFWLVLLQLSNARAVIVWTKTTRPHNAQILNQCTALHLSPQIFDSPRVIPHIPWIKISMISYCPKTYLNNSISWLLPSSPWSPSSLT